MSKNIVLILISMVLIGFGFTASASTCSYMSSDCMGKYKNNDKKLGFDVDLDDLVSDHKDKGDKGYGYRGRHSISYDEMKKRGMRFGKAENHAKSDKWLSYDDDSDAANSDAGNSDAMGDSDDMHGFWVFGFDKKGHRGFMGRHKHEDFEVFKTWVKSHNPHYAEKVPEVPVPAAAWLFGSGLLGLSAVAYRKKRN